MNNRKRGRKRGMGRTASTTAAALLASLLLAGCSTFGSDDSSISADDQPSQLAPVTDSAVSSDSLPPINGAAGPQVADAGPPGPADYGTTGALPPGPPRGPASGAGMPVLLGNGAPLAPAAATAAGGGRNLAGGVTTDRLLGGWTVTSGASQCRLNLTNTVKDPTSGHFRASAPGCSITALASVSSWQLAGSQVQLFNYGDTLVGTLLLAGGRFIGTLSGGQAITMAG